MSLLHKIRKDFLNLPGWRTRRKLVVIESDDWGTVTMPPKEQFSRLMSTGIKLPNHSFARYDSLESETDLDALFNVLAAYRDINGNPPCMTLCSIMANPDFRRIEEADFQQYFYEPFSETYKRYPNHANSLGVIKNGIQEGLVYPQLHGREHLNPSEFLKVLKKGGDERVLFENECLIGLSGSSPSKRRHGYHAAFDYETEDELASFEVVIKDAQRLFFNAFGFKSLSFVAPTGIRSDKIDAFLADAGIRYHQLAQQMLPGFEGYKTRNRVTGSSNRYGQLYWRRNGFFEPSRDQQFDWVARVLSEMESAFKFGKPFVISTHRVNYIGGIDPRNRESSLRWLDKLLKAMLKKHPEIEFLSSEALGKEMESRPSYFLNMRFKNKYFDLN